MPPAPPLHVEQQLRDAQYALAAADCAQLALMLANERLRALCYADTLAALRDDQAAAALAQELSAASVEGQHEQQLGCGNDNGSNQDMDSCSITAAVERVCAC